MKKEMGKLIANLALNVAKQSKGWSCWWFSKQPKVPKELDKFIK